MQTCPYCHQRILLPDYKFCPYCAWRFEENAPRAEFELGRLNALETIKKEFRPWIKGQYAILIVVLSIFGYIATFLGDDLIGRIVSQQVSEQLEKRLPVEINHSVKETMGNVSLQLYNLVDIFPVMEYEFYRFRELDIFPSEIYFNDDFRNKLRGLNICKGEIYASVGILPYLVNERNAMLLNMTYYAHEYVKERYNKIFKFYWIGSTTSNTGHTVSGTIYDVLEGTSFLEYLLFVNVRCDKDKWKGFDKDTLPEKVTEIIFNIKKEALFNIRLNYYPTWEIRTSDLEFERKPLKTEQRQSRIGTNYTYVYTGKKKVEDMFKYRADIKKQYREALLKK